MLEKLRQIENRYAELESKLADPAYYSDPAVFTKLCREQRELQPVVEAYRAYTACQAQIAQAEALLDDPELHEIAREEIEQGRARCAELEQQLRVLLLPRDPNDDRNVILEIRTGVGGEESALFAHSLYRMYNMYADAHGWKTEIANLNETELGGVREASLLISGQGAYSRLKFESGVHRVQRVPETETGGRIHHENRDIGLVEHEVRPAHPFFTERSLIIQSRRVDDNDRTEGEQLHRLADRVGRCTAHLGNYRKVPARSHG